MILELDPFYKLLKNSTNIDFAENQLSPDSISFSLLTTNHPNLLQQTRVQPFHKNIRAACSWLDHLVSGLIHITL